MSHVALKKINGAKVEKECLKLKNNDNDKILITNYSKNNNNNNTWVC